VIVTLLLVFGMLFTGLTALSTAAFGAYGIFAMASGVEVPGAGAVLNPATVLSAVFLFAAALGSGGASAYLGYLLWQRHRDWERWKDLKPGRSYWEFAADAAMKRRRR